MVWAQGEVKNEQERQGNQGLQRLHSHNQELKYVLVSESGPDHDKTFEVEVHLNSNVIGKGVAGSKKKAEQAAAQQALELMGI